MYDPLLVLAIVFEVGYLTRDEVRRLPAWRRLSPELQAILGDDHLAEEGEDGIVGKIHDLRRSRGLQRCHLSEVSTRVTCHFRLGLLYLTYQKGRMDTLSLLYQGWFVADSYLCEVACGPFIRLHRRLKVVPTLEHDAAQVSSDVARLFRPYIGLASRCINRWGLV